MKYRAILFDFDGTLVPSLPFWIKAFRKTLGSHGVDASDDDVVRRCLYRPFEDVAVDFGIYPAKDFSIRFEQNLRGAFRDAELFPSARDVLVHCRNLGLRTALVTSSPRIILIEAVSRLGLVDLFDLVISGDDVRNYKPHPEPLLTALGTLGCTPCEAIMVGDSQADVLAGKAAGTSTALFLPAEYARFNHANLQRMTDPDLVFSDLAELPSLLGLPPVP